MSTGSYENVAHLKATSGLKTVCANVKDAGLENDDEVTINELARRIVAMTGSSSEVRQSPYRDSYGSGVEDMQRRVPSLEKIRKAVGYIPELRRYDILRDVIGEIQEELGL